MLSITKLEQFKQSCLDLASQYPEPHRTQALCVIGKSQNWPAKFEQISQNLIQTLEVAE